MFNELFNKMLTHSKNVNIKTVSNKCNLFSTVSSVNDIHVPNVGYIQSTGDGVASILGLNNVTQGELVAIYNPKDLDVSKPIMFGLVLELGVDVKVALFGQNKLVKQGFLATATQFAASMIITPNVLGNVIDAVGNMIYLPWLKTTNKERKFQEITNPTQDYMRNFRASMDEKAPGISSRMGVCEPILTGTKIVDFLIPIGRGQRELIIGDRQTGKTTIAVDAILNQQNIWNTNSRDFVYCVYCAIGQKRSTVAQLIYYLYKEGAMNYTTVVAATASDAAALQYLAAYSGCTVGEYFRDAGFHSLVIYDDLSKQALAYRQMALLIRRPPGREAYPGDIFYLHARLLERAAKLSEELGGGSLTALPVIETQMGDLTAFIATNVISITDGQIFLNKDIRNQNIWPAVDVGLSVSRVGSNAYVHAMKQMATSLKVELAQFNELSYFVSFMEEIVLPPVVMQRLERGLRLTEILTQFNHFPLSPELEIIIVFAGVNGYLDLIAPKNVSLFEDFIVYVLTNNSSYKDIWESVEPYGSLEDQLIILEGFLNEVMTMFKETV